MKRMYLVLTLIYFFSPHTSFANESFINHKQVYSYRVLEQDIKQLEKQYGDVIRVTSIGRSYLGRELWAIKLGKGNSNILMIGSHHGREWMTTSILMKMLEEYAKAYQKGTNYRSHSDKLLDKVSIWFVPMLNPDGVMIQQNGIEDFSFIRRWKLKRMNEGSNDFARWKANAKGIDLNRQYPSGWEQIKAGPTKPYYQFYKGKKPLQARESVAITHFTKKVKPTIAVAYHSSGREVFWNYKNGKNLGRDRRIAEKVAKTTKYQLSKPSKNATGAGYTDWFITNFHLPAMTIEICPFVKETSPPLSLFEEEWERNREVGFILIKEASNIPNNNNKK